MMAEKDTQTINLANLKYNKEISIATATNREASKWKNQSVTISKFLSKISNTVRTNETMSEFLRMPKGDQDKIKDVGAFVGGMLKGGRRRKTDVANRHILTLDADYAGPDTIGKIKKTFKSICHTVYSTHKHQPEKPRLRLILYPDRPMTPDEYQAVMRMVADKIDIDAFDDTTYDTNRLMYWPSTPSDGEYLFYHNDAPYLKIKTVLDAYGDDDAWKDVSLWPVSSRETRNLSKLLKHQADPMTKKGVVGAFCRNISIYKALDDHLSDVYRKESKDRYTYIEGTSSKGLVVYGNKFVYSNHGSDPASGQTCNAFDIIRIHKFGHLDDKAKAGTPTHRLPSYVEMEDYARKIEAVELELIKNNMVISADEFDDFAEDGGDWLTDLKRTQNDTIKPTFFNIHLILTNDPKIKNLMRKNLFSGYLERSADGELWTPDDTDDIRVHIEKKYAVEFAEAKIERAIEFRGTVNGYHPVKDYINGLKWDGVERVETLFIDYFKCPDNPYIREATLCWFTAAVARIYDPGTKFDNVIVLGGDQEIGKTTLIEVLSKQVWYGALSSFDNKIAMEETNGKWLIEIAELSATNKQEIEQQKAFLSARSTKVRMAYARRATEFPRQCVFIGTTNADEYLKDRTGNRRWWPFDSPLKQNGEKYDLKQLKADVDQVWAEAFYLYAMSHPLTLSKEARVMAQQAQENKLVSDEWEGKINEWLNTDALKDRYQTNHEYSDGEIELRDRVCISEIIEDCLDLKRDAKQFDRNRINSIMNRNMDWEKKSTMRFGERFGTQRGWHKVVPF